MYNAFKNDFDNSRFILGSAAGIRDTHGKQGGGLDQEPMKMGTLRLDPGQIEVVDDTMAEILRHKTPAERIRIGFTLWTSARNMLMTHLRKTHPEWNDDRVGKEVARRLSHGAV